MYNNELYHHGILGMKWGIIRTPEELGHEILKNDAKRAEVAAKIAKMERSHEMNPNKRYHKSEARLYKKAAKLEREREDLEMDKAVAEKWKAAADAQREYEDSQKAKKEAERGINSHNLQDKPLSQMSDKELADYLTRKANEKRYLEYNPPKKTTIDKFKEFAGKNTGKAGQALMDVGIEIGKDALKKELQKQLKEESPNSWEKLSKKDITKLNDKDMETLSKRIEQMNKTYNAMKNMSKMNSESNENTSTFSEKDWERIIEELVKRSKNQGATLV